MMSWNPSGEELVFFGVSIFWLIISWENSFLTASLLTVYWD